MTEFRLGVDQLSIQNVIDICNGEMGITLDGEARARVRKSAQYVAKIVESGEVVNGVNTGFGQLCNTLILKAHNLSYGYSGIREKTLDRILFFIENDIIPEVPEQGSVGASGDLAPLAHLFLPLIGLGKVHYKGAWKDTSELLQELNLEP